MEQLLLKINTAMDDVKKEKEDIKTEMELNKVEKIKLEERSNFMRE